MILLFVMFLSFVISFTTGFRYENEGQPIHLVPVYAEELRPIYEPIICEQELLRDEIIERLDPFSLSESEDIIIDVILDSSERHDVDPLLVVAVGSVESSWRLHVRGRAGEYGPLQVLPSTFYAMGGSNPHDWRESLDIGVKYLAKMLDRADGCEELALAYYNAGPSRPQDFVQRITRTYVSNVLSHR